MEDLSKSNVRLLVIDDESSTLEVLKFQLENLGCTVYTAIEAARGLEILNENEVDLVISDVAMPKMNGLEFLDRVKQMRPDLPVILLSGHGSVDMAVDAMKRGAADFIAKPAAISEISVRIEKALEGAERKKSCRTLKEQVEELKRVCEDFGKSSDSRFQAEKLAAISLIVSGIAHEINNPLTAVIGYSQLLIDTGGQDMTRQLQVVRDQAQRCAKIIQDLMFFARRRKPIFADINLLEAVEGAIEETKEELNSRKIALSFVPDTAELHMQGDSGLLRKVFSQMLLNAADALEEIEGKRQIDFRISDGEHKFQVEIHDNGPGIASEHLTRIFDPFFSTKEVGRGAGLGLSLCYGLIADHGGQILVKNKNEGGALFTVLLPKVKLSSRSDKIASK